MAESYKLLNYAGLTKYDELIKGYIDEADALSIKYMGISDDGKTVSFYKTYPVDEDSTPEYTFDFPVTDLSEYMKLVGAAVEGNIAVFDADGQVVDSGSALAELATMAYVGELPEDAEATTITDWVAEVQAALEAAITASEYDDTEVKASIAENAAAIAENAAAIEVLNGDEETEGSVAKAVADAQAELEAEIAVKADAATTLEGYGIEDAYTKTETDTAIQTAIAATGHASFTKVDAVPDAADAEENILYLVENPETGHLDIYALIDGAMEWLDDVEIDLTPYSTTEEMNAAIESALADYVTSDDMAEALAEYVKSEDLATTLEDYYTKDETYTKEEVDEKLTEAGIEIETITDEEIAELFE